MQMHHGAMAGRVKRVTNTFTTSEHVLTAGSRRALLVRMKMKIRIEAENFRISSRIKTKITGIFQERKLSVQNTQTEIKTRNFFLN